MRPGEAMISDDGIEGSLVYALSAAIRERIKAEGRATLLIDLAPGRSLERVQAEVAHPRGARSWPATCKAASASPACDGPAAGMPAEAVLADPPRWPRPSRPCPHPGRAAALDEAISSAGGVRFEALDAGLMIRAVPGVFCAARCSTGKPPPAATCSPPAWPAAAGPARACWRGWHDAERPGTACNIAGPGGG
jgi:hypothetical protein